jgi:regulator of replication initiation timing
MKKCFDLIQELDFFITSMMQTFGQKRIAQVKTENSDLKTENASLKEQVQKLIEENRRL